MLRKPHGADRTGIVSEDGSSRLYEVTIEDVLLVSLALLSGLGVGLAVFAVAWLTNWIFKTCLPQRFRTPVLLIVGVILLIIGLLLMTSVLP